MRNPHKQPTRIVFVRSVLLALVMTCSFAPSSIHARSIYPSAQAVNTSAKVTIAQGLFSRATVVVLKGGTLTIVNSDNLAYRIKIGATVVVLPAKVSKTIPLPQRGTFSITCTKFPALHATLTVK